MRRFRPMVVSIADCRVSGDPASELVTYALGSCLAVAVYDPAARVGGLLHFLLPDSALNPGKAAQNPYLFADTGIRALLEEVRFAGAALRRLTVFFAGASEPLPARRSLALGRLNYEAARELIRRGGLDVHAEAVGGTLPRTLRLEIGTGTVWVRSMSGREQPLAPTPGRSR